MIQFTYITNISCFKPHGDCKAETYSRYTKGSEKGI